MSSRRSNTTSNEAWGCQRGGRVRSSSERASPRPTWSTTRERNEGQQSESRKPLTVTGGSRIGIPPLHLRPRSRLTQARGVHELDFTRCSFVLVERAAEEIASPDLPGESIAGGGGV